MAKETLTAPMQIRLPDDLREKIAKISDVNHLSEADVVRLCLAEIVPQIEQNGLTIRPAIHSKPARRAA